MELEYRKGVCPVCGEYRGVLVVKKGVIVRELYCKLCESKINSLGTKMFINRELGKNR